jgi:hypothetical protein
LTRETASYQCRRHVGASFGVGDLADDCIGDFDDYDERAGLLQEQVELLALVRDARISSAQLRAILELSPQAREAIVSLVQATARDDTR